MAVIQFGPLVTGARGKFLGSQFSINRSGAVLQKKCLQRQGATNAQSVLRSNFSRLARHWRSLSPADVEANNIAAQEYPYTDRFGNTRYFTGYQLLLRSNLNRYYSGLGPIDVVPTPPPLAPDMFIVAGEVFYTNTGVLTITLDFAFSGSPMSGYTIQWFASPGVSEGVSVWSGRYEYVATFDLEDESATILNPSLSVAVSWNVGAKVFLRGVIVHNDSGIEVGNYVSTSVIVQQ